MKFFIQLLFVLLFLVISTNSIAFKCHATDTLEDCKDKPVCHLSCQTLLQDKKCKDKKITFEVTRGFFGNDETKFKKAFDTVCLEKKYAGSNLLDSFLEKLNKNDAIYKLLKIKVKIWRWRKWCEEKQEDEGEVTRRLKWIKDQGKSHGTAKLEKEIHSKPTSTNAYLAAYKKLYQLWLTSDSNSNCRCSDFYLYVNDRLRDLNKQLEEVKMEIQDSLNDVTLKRLKIKQRVLKGAIAKEDAIKERIEAVIVSAKKQCRDKYKHYQCGNLLNVKVNSKRINALNDYKKQEDGLKEYKRKSAAQKHKLHLYNAELSQLVQQLSRKNAELRGVVKKVNNDVKHDNFGDSGDEEEGGEGSSDLPKEYVLKKLGERIKTHRQANELRSLINRIPKRQHNDGSMKALFVQGAKKKLTIFAYENSITKTEKQKANTVKRIEELKKEIDRFVKKSQQQIKKAKEKYLELQDKYELKRQQVFEKITEFESKKAQLLLDYQRAKRIISQKKKSRRDLLREQLQLNKKYLSDVEKITTDYDIKVQTLRDEMAAIAREIEVLKKRKEKLAGDSDSDSEGVLDSEVLSHVAVVERDIRRKRAKMARKLRQLRNLDKAKKDKESILNKITGLEKESLKDNPLTKVDEENVLLTKSLKIEEVRKLIDEKKRELHNIK